MLIGAVKISAVLLGVVATDTGLAPGWHRVPLNEAGGRNGQRLSADRDMGDRILLGVCRCECRGSNRVRACGRGAALPDYRLPRRLAGRRPWSRQSLVLRDVAAIRAVEFAPQLGFELEHRFPVTSPDPLRR